VPSFDRGGDNLSLLLVSKLHDLFFVILADLVDPILMEDISAYNEETMGFWCHVYDV
jgi:hypothetical protein